MKRNTITGRKDGIEGYSAAPVNVTVEYPATHCRCGGGLCLIKPHSKTGRLFYSCPARAEYNCEFFKWCDKLKSNEILNVRPHPYPICSCEAGVCRLETENGQKFFACRIKKGYGACNFHLWYDDFLCIMNTTSIENEIHMIYEALENGEFDLDFPNPGEEAQDEIKADASIYEMFDGYNDESSYGSPCMNTNGNIETFALSSFAHVAQDMASRGTSGDEWWF